MESEEANLIRRIASIRPYKKRDVCAPHKPLYLLYLISRIQKDSARLQLYKSIEPVLKSALEIFGPSTKQVHAEYPFWRIQNDCLGEVQAEGPLELRKSNSDPKRTSLIELNARGGLKEADWELLNENPRLRDSVIHMLLDQHFPDSLHEDILQFFEMRLPSFEAESSGMSKGNRSTVLERYHHRCAVSGFSVQFDDFFPGLEIAHVVWPQCGGLNDIRNCIAMSVLHRRLFHLGLFCIDESFTIRVSPRVRDGSTSTEKTNFSLVHMARRKLRLPDSEDEHPSLQGLAWHRKWVFKE